MIEVNFLGLTEPLFAHPYNEDDIHFLEKLQRRNGYEVVNITPGTQELSGKVSCCYYCPIYYHIKS